MREIIGRGHSSEAELLDALTAAVLEGAERAGVLVSASEPAWQVGDVVLDAAGELHRRRAGGWQQLIPAPASSLPTAPLTPLVRDGQPWTAL